MPENDNNFETIEDGEIEVFENKETDNTFKTGDWLVYGGTFLAILVAVAFGLL